MKDDYRLTVIDCGALINTEILKAGENSERLSKKVDNQALVDDRTVIELVTARVAECEKESRSYVLEGFPRTKVQALALEEMGIIPDKVINTEEPGCPSFESPELAEIEEGNVPSLLPLFA